MPPACPTTSRSPPRAIRPCSAARSRIAFRILPLLLDAHLRVPRQDMRNHNHLLGRVDGVDGIKTGYIHDSGSTSSPRCVAAGATSWRSCSADAPAVARDARVVSLIDDNIQLAAAKRTAPPIVEGWKSPSTRARKGRRGNRRGCAGAASRRAGARLHRSDQAQSGEDLHRAGRRHAHRRRCRRCRRTTASSCTVSGPSQGHDRQCEARGSARCRRQNPACSACCRPRLPPPATACRSRPQRRSPRPSRAAAAG